MNHSSITLFILLPSIILIFLYIWYLIKDEIIGETEKTKNDIGYEILRRRRVLKRDVLSLEEIDNILKNEFIYKYKNMTEQRFLTYLAYCNHYDSILKNNTNKFVKFSYTDHCNCKYNTFMYNHYGTKSSIDDFTIYEPSRSGSGHSGGSSSSSSQSSHSYNFDDRRYL